MGRTTQFRFLALTGAVLLAAGAWTPARAQDPEDLKRGVARISLINGDVSVRRGDSGDWVAGVINAPLMTDDRIASGPSSRGEVQFDSSNMLRFGANTEMRLSQLEYSRYQMELAHGIITFRVQRPSDVNIEVDTPSISVRPQRAGDYRISVNEAGETEVTARGGDVEIFTPAGSQWVRSGQTLMARGSASDPEFQVVAANPPDDWDRWNEARDRTLMQSPSARYVGPGVYGAEDLDNNGNWVNVPDYGMVWQPNVAADWAPYQYGRWVWQDWYGWTWVSYDPWGWAPYHYGRWFWHGGWCWYPGVFGVRHYWSPALVGFFGFGGGGVGVGFGFGHIGWVPLAPYEVFHPWWGHGFYGPGGFNRSVNVTNVNITSVYRNARINNGIHGVALNEFQNGHFNSIQRFNGSQIQTAGLVRGQLPVEPSRSALRFSDRQAVAAPHGNQPARFFTHQQPNPVARQPFAGSATASRPQSSPSQALAPNRTTPGEAGGSWRRFGASAGPASNPQSAGNPGNSFRGNGNSTPLTHNDRPPQIQSGNQQAAPRSSWQRFGETPRSYNAPRQSAPSYSQPRQSAPSYSQPRQSAPSYSAPRQQSAPSYSAPRGNSGGGGGSRPSGGGGGGHSSGGGSHGGGGRR